MNSAHGVSRRPWLETNQLPACRQFLAEPDPAAARRLLGEVVNELVVLAAEEHGTDPATRIPVEWRASSDGPRLTSVDSVRAGWPSARACMLLSRSAVEGDYRSQVLYQAAHEAVHAACTAGLAGGWPDEMFAVWFAVRVMGRLRPEYAHNTVSKLVAAAQGMTIEELVAYDFLGYIGTPDRDIAMYGRAYVLGLDLEGALGWEAVRTLVSQQPPDEPIDVARWLQGLTTQQHRELEAVGFPLAGHAEV
jgi:hypothetical protein